MRKVQVRGEIGPDVANWPVANSKTRKLKRMTTVRMNVARSEPMFSTPIFVKIAVRAANTADSSAHSCQDSSVMHFPLPLAASFNGQNVNSTEAYQETWLVSLAFSIPRLT
jgi:hypothetical protein